MTTLFVLALISLAFLIGVRVGCAFTRAGHVQDHLVEAFERDQAVVDEAEELPYRASEDARWLL